MRDFSAWLKPTLLGPLLPLWTLISLAHFTVGVAAVTAGKIDDWLVGMLTVSFFGAGLGVLLIAADLALLKFRLRRLPTGVRAWLSSAVSPFAVTMVWSYLPPPQTPAYGVAFVVIPMVVATFAVRLLLGTKPSAV